MVVKVGWLNADLVHFGKLIRESRPQARRRLRMGPDLRNVANCAELMTKSDLLDDKYKLTTLFNCLNSAGSQRRVLRLLPLQVVQIRYRLECPVQIQ